MTRPSRAVCRVRAFDDEGQLPMPVRGSGLARGCSQVSGPIDLALFDRTTVSFESACEGSLRAHVRVKDGKHGKVQVSLSAAVARSGLPLGYEVFPGDTLEGAVSFRCRARCFPGRPWRSWPAARVRSSRTSRTVSKRRRTGGSLSVPVGTTRQQVPTVREQTFHSIGYRPRAGNDSTSCSPRVGPAREVNGFRLRLRPGKGADAALHVFRHPGHWWREYGATAWRGATRP